MSLARIHFTAATVMLAMSVLFATAAQYVPASADLYCRIMACFAGGFAMISFWKGMSHAERRR